MIARSKFDQNQIFQFSFDEDAAALRTKLTDTQLSIELSHKDGDSVTAHPFMINISAIDVKAEEAGKEVIPPFNASSLRRINVRVEGTGSIKIMASPLEKGDFFYWVGNEGLYDICARRIKVVSDELVGNVHLVGQS